MHFNGAAYKIPACQLPYGFLYGALRGVLFFNEIKRGGLVHENNVNVIKYIYIYTSEEQHSKQYSKINVALFVTPCNLSVL